MIRIVFQNCAYIVCLFSAVIAKIGKARSFVDFEAENEILLFQAFYNKLIIDCVNSDNIRVLRISQSIDCTGI